MNEQFGDPPFVVLQGLERLPSESVDPHGKERRVIEKLEPKWHSGEFH